MPFDNLALTGIGVGAKMHKQYTVNGTAHSYDMKSVPPLGNHGLLVKEAVQNPYAARCAHR